MTKILEAALAYWDRGFAVIPIIPNSKKPLIKWEAYQTLRPDRDQVEVWFEENPEANLALLMGAVSGIDVIDIDTQEAMDKLLETHRALIAGCPLAKTPGGGFHIYLKYTNIRRKIKVMEGIDFCGDGGYVLAPPSKIDDRPYIWINNIATINPGELPTDLFEQLTKKPESSDPVSNAYRDRQIDFSEGSRDETLFHIANSMRKGGMSEEKIEQVVMQLAGTCDFTEKEAYAKVQSAIKRNEEIGKTLTDEVKEWIMESDGAFSLAQLYGDLEAIDQTKKRTIRRIVNRFKEEGIVASCGSKRGMFRIIDGDTEPIDFTDESEDTVDILLPHRLHEFIEILPGNIILVAGEPNAGKTAMLLNIAAMNMKNFETHYFNSEMGGRELRKRLMKFDPYITMEDWKEYLHAWERSSNFADVIKTGKGILNIIDFMEIHEEFYRIGHLLNEIHVKLDGAICVVALQKKRGAEMGRGAEFSLEKPRLALALSRTEQGNQTMVVKAKNWKGAVNPNGKIIRWKLINGCDFREYDNELTYDPTEDMREPYK